MTICHLLATGANEKVLVLTGNMEKGQYKGEKKRENGEGGLPASWPDGHQEGPDSCVCVCVHVWVCACVRFSM